MYEIISVIRKDVCPNSEEYITVKIDYAKMPMRGNPRYGYKKIGFECPSQCNCDLYDIRTGCPLYQNAPSQP